MFGFTWLYKMTFVIIRTTTTIQW